MAAADEGFDIARFVRMELRGRFGRLAEPQSDLLLFAVLAMTAEDLSGPVEDNSKMKALQLQIVMDRRSKFISTLNEILKKIASTQDTIVQNIK